MPSKSGMDTDHQICYIKHKSDDTALIACLKGNKDSENMLVGLTIIIPLILFLVFIYTRD